jgi:hypothetical protein
MAATQQPWTGLQIETSFFPSHSLSISVRPPSSLTAWRVKDRGELDQGTLPAKEMSNGQAS